MNRHHVAFFVAVLLILFLGTIMVYVLNRHSRDFTASPSIRNSQEETHLRSPSVTNVHEHQETPFTLTNIDYPHFTGEVAVLNAPIEQLLRNGIMQHDKDSAENWQARVDTADPKGSIPAVPLPDERFPYHASWSLQQFDTARVSVLIQYDEFSGGAHGSEANASFSYDFKTHKISTIADLFPGDPTYLDKISKAAIASLVADRKSATGESALSADEINWINQGAGPKPENFSVFTTHDNRLTIYFAQYQVGPYVIGMPKVELYLPLP